MSTYAIGDVQGCHATLLRLLQRIEFDPDRDRLWFAGDLVNRGPRSLDVLRFVRDLGDRAIAVLGNHDIHLLARGAGVAEPKRRDTLEDVLAAPDCDALLAWLRQRPLLHREGQYLMVHAGLLPAWTPDDAEAIARETEAVLRGPRGDDALVPRERPEALNALTRLRVCTPEGRMEVSFDGPPAGAPEGYYPWFDVPGRRSRDATVLFGHWSALGLDVADDHVGLDSGCVWGGSLSAMRLEDRQIFQEPAVEPSARGA